MNETAKCRPYREQANHFKLYLKGKGIDIGCGGDKLIVEEGSVYSWDLSNGDAMLMEGAADESYDFVYSSHCLEHLKDVEVSLLNWIRVIKKGGYLYFVVPEYVLYEKMTWPSIYNTDHKQTFSYYITNDQVKRGNHYHYTDVAKILKRLGMEVLITELEDKNFDYSRGSREDQTRGTALCQILFVARKENQMSNSKIPVEIVQTDYGSVIILSKDTNQSGALRNTKKAFDWQEVNFLNHLIKDIDGPVFFDVGANLGSFTLGLAKTIEEKNGSIHSFEPQRIVYNCLAGSIALNGYAHIYAYHAAIGRSEEDFIEAPQFNYAETCSFGSVEFGELQKERLHQVRQENNKKEYVRIFPLDDFTDKINKLDLLKIDVEGMEESVLASAKQIIARYKPILFVEFLKSNKTELRKIIEELGYRNISEVGVNFLCVN